MECREVQRLADLSLDGEVSPREQAELDSHLVRCAACRSRATTQRWVHDSIRAKLQDSVDGVAPPQGLQARIQTELRAEGGATGGTVWRAALPLSMAMAVVAILSWSRSHAPSLDPEGTVDRHTQNMLPEVRARGGEQEVQRYIQKQLGHSVDLPLPDERNLRLVGARVSSLDDGQAVHLLYDHRGARISLFANPKRGAVVVPASFSRRLVAGRPYLVGSHRGYNVVATERDDVLYRFVSDVDGAELVRIAASVHR
jgi:anti-sigma factor RsiW